jgi:gliding motility-associated-like protein
LPVSDTVKVNFTPAPKVSATSAFPCVYTNGVDLTGLVTDGATQGIWKTSGSGIFSPNNAALNVKYYPSETDKDQGDLKIYLVSTNNGNCLPDSVELNLIVAPLPIADAGEDRYVCTGLFDTLIANPGTNYVYSWREIGGTFSANNTDKVVVGPITSAVKTFELRVDDNKGCTAFDTINVFAVENPNFYLDEKFCLIPSMKITAKAPDAVNKATFQWYRDGVLLQGANDTVLRVFQPGIYTITYSLGKCNTYNSQTRIIQPPLLVTLDHIYCKGDLATASVKNLLPSKVSYVWTLNGNTIGGNDSIVTSVVTADTTIFNVQVTDLDACSSKDSVFIIAKQRPQMALNINSPGCKGSSVWLDATPDIKLSGAIRNWFKDGKLLPDTTAILEVNERNYGAGRFIVNYFLDKCIALDTADVVFNNLPSPPLSGSSTEFCSLVDITKTLNANPSNLPLMRFKWLTPTNQSLNAVDTMPYYIVDSTGFNNKNSKVFRVQVTNEFNCSIIDSILLNDYCVPKVYIPSALTPNNDGINDKLQIFGLEKYFKNFEMYIFNRWGEVIFKTNDPNDFWDGTYRGQLMPAGTYPYLVTFESTDPRDKTKYKNQGKVTVVR